MLLHFRKVILSCLVIIATLTLGSGAFAATDLSKTVLSNKYSPHFLRFIQLAYGTEGIISQGGFDSIDIMFSGIDLNGKTILDVGSGFGGVDVYLAQKYDVNIIGVDLEPFMIMYSDNLLAEQKGSLKGKVLFQILKEPTSLREFPDNAFDIVYCKEMLYHIPLEMKQFYIDEMYRVLKPEGKIVIADWCKSSPKPGDWLQLSLTKGRKEFSHYIMPQDLTKILLKANFRHITFTDVSEDHITYTKDDIDRMDKATDQIDQELGKGTCQPYIEKWNIWLKALESQQLVAGIFIGIKSP